MKNSFSADGGRGSVLACLCPWASQSVTVCHEIATWKLPTPTPLWPDAEQRTLATTTTTKTRRSFSRRCKQPGFIGERPSDAQAARWPSSPPSRRRSTLRANFGAVALSPHDVSLLEARSGACARLDKHAACLHDGELIVRLTPDWYRGHAICGSALFCLKQYTASVLAYRRALGFAVGSPAERGLQSALVDACGRVDGALRQCSMLGDTTQLCSLLSSGAARIDAPDEKHGFTPLLLAAAAGHPGCVRALLDGGACAGARDRYGKTALMWAAAQRHEGVADVLLRRCASEAASLVATDSAGWDALHAACLSGCLPLVERLLPLADVGRAAVDGSTYLHAAAQGGHVAVARLLLDRRADPSARQTRGKRPLDLASAARKSEVVALLRPLTPELPVQAGPCAARAPTHTIRMH